MHKKNTELISLKSVEIEVKKASFSNTKQKQTKLDYCFATNFGNILECAQLTPSILTTCS